MLQRTQYENVYPQVLNQPRKHAPNDDISLAAKLKRRLADGTTAAATEDDAVEVTKDIYLTGADP